MERKGLLEGIMDRREGGGWPAGYETWWIVRWKDGEVADEADLV